jgi:hypothetical protein
MRRLVIGLWIKNFSREQLKDWRMLLNDSPHSYLIQILCKKNSGVSVRIAGKQARPQARLQALRMVPVRHP